MNSTTTLVSLIAIVAILFSITIFTLETCTTIRWQERAIATYNTAILNNTKPPHCPENWWTDNAFAVAFSVWKEDPYNWLSLFVSILAYLFAILKKRIEKRPHEGP